VKYLSLIAKNTLRNRRRSILTILSIAFSLCLLGLLTAIYHLFYFSEPTADSALRLIVRNRVSLANPMPLSYKAKIEQTPGVAGAMILQWYGGTYKDNRDSKNFFARFALDADKLPLVYPEYKVAPEQWRAFVGERTACLVGRKLARRHDFKIGDRIPLTGDIFPSVELTVRAFYDSDVDNESVFFHWAYLTEVIRGGGMGQMDVASTFVVRLHAVRDAPAVARAIDAQFRNSPMQTKTETEQAFAQSFLAFLGNVKLMILSICGAIAFTILLVSGNTMAMSVRERVREVGVLKTLGFTRGGILGILLAESVFIAFIGGVIGLALAQAICVWMRTLPPMMADFSMMTVPPNVAALCLGVAAFVGLVSCSVPAWSAARRPIVDSLRFTG
jgi:putative ABC transport system permease protein